MAKHRELEMAYQLWMELPVPVYVEALCDDFEGFRLLLRGDDLTEPVVRIQFADWHAYRRVNTSRRLQNLEHCSSGRTSAIFEVTDSAWLESLNVERMELFPERALRHFSVHSADACLDIVTGSEPIVDYLG